jgi:lipopolysaccharide biosynthesis protein
MPLELGRMPLDADMSPNDTELIAPVSRPTPVTIFVHIFHLEIWPEILTNLNELTLPYQLVLTSPHPEAAIRLPRNAVEIEFHRTANLGRDIGPFLIAFSKTRLATDICLKIHTKRSLHRSDGEAWRKAIVSDLLGDPNKVSRTAMLLRENPNIGLVAPSNHLVPVSLFLGCNGDKLKELFEIYGIDEAATDISKSLFVAGSMFWFRSEALSSLRRKSFAIEFEPEDGQLDGARAHAHERIFSLLAELQGFISVTIDELTKRDDDIYRALPPSERLKRDNLLFSKEREAVEISPFIGQPVLKHRWSRSRRLYRKLPVGFRRLIRRAFRLPH